MIHLLLLGLLLLPWTAEAHPGRLNNDGCHYVRRDFTYKSGKVVRAGDYHCHRLLRDGQLVLDGREVLMDDRRKIDREEGEEGEAP